MADLDARLALELRAIRAQQGEIIASVAESKQALAAEVATVADQLDSKVKSIMQPQVAKVTGRVHEGFGTKLTVAGTNFAKGCWVTVEGDAVDAPIKLVTEFKSASLVVASTKAGTNKYAPQRSYRVRVTNPIGGFTDVRADAGAAVDASVAFKTAAGSLGMFRRAPATYGKVAFFSPAGQVRLPPPWPRILLCLSIRPLPVFRAALPRLASGKGSRHAAEVFNASLFLPLPLSTPQVQDCVERPTESSGHRC